MKCRALWGGIVLLVLLSGTASSSITRMYSLQEVLNESTNVFVGRLETVDRQKRTAVAVVERALKGNKEYERVQMNLGLGPGDHAKYLLDRWEPGTAFLLFYQRTGNPIAALGHAGDTWFQLFATHNNDGSKVWWNFTHLEIYMGRTYNGSTKDFIKLTDDVLAKRLTPPAPNPNVPKLDITKPQQRAVAVAQAGAGSAADLNVSEVVMAKGSSWKYLKATREASNDAPDHAAWRAPGFDDSSWPSGHAPFGYGDPPFGTTLDDMQQNANSAGYSSLFLRRHFQLADPASIVSLEFNIDYDDGFVLWINGNLAVAANQPAKITRSALSPLQHESGSYEPFAVSDPQRFLVPGTNSIAVQVFNAALHSSDLKIDIEMKIGWARGIAKGSVWQYLKGTREASADAPEYAAWRTVEFDDSSWTSGQAPFGYGDGPFGTELSDMPKTTAAPGYSSVFLRKEFQIPDAANVGSLELHIDYDDGFVLWINGREVVGVNKPVGQVSHNAVAAAQHESGAYEQFTVPNAHRYLNSGKNIVALQAFNAALTSSDLKIDVEMKIGFEQPSGFRRALAFEHVGGEIRGVSWADINGDERLDAYLCRGTANLLLVNEGNEFRDRTAVLGPAGGSRAAAWADYNGDDHPDLLTNNFQLFTNVGGQFRDDSKLLPAPNGRNPEGAGWIDYNGDGLPDILVTNGEHGICLFENTGTGPTWFRDVSDKAGLGATGLGKGNGDFVVFADYDGDGYTDFLYNLGTGVLAHNEGDGRFKLDTRSGIELPGPDYKRGVAFADFDNDGDLDLFVPAPGRARLYQNNNDGSFTDVIESAGDLAGASSASFAAAWGDINNDGSLDLFVCHTQGPSRLYLGSRNGKFQDVTREVDLDDLTPAFGASFADVDDDGDLDLSVNLQGRVVLVTNAMSRRSDYGALKVRVQSRKGLAGAVVRVQDSTGKHLGMHELNGAESCGGQASPVAHFGAPIGECRVSVCLSDGRVAQKTVTVSREGTTLTLREEEFVR